MRSLVTALACVGLFAGAANAQFSTTNPGQTKVPATRPTTKTPGGAFTPAPRVNINAPSMLVGGGNFCTAPDVVGGDNVNVTFDLTAATTGAEGQNEGLCYAFSTTGITTDVWFAWTPVTSGTAVVTTCGLTGVDTKVAAYPGAACPTNGTALACNDDACGLQSTISWSATGGSTYMVQIGTFPGASVGSGNISMSIAQPPPNDECANAIPIAGQGFFAFDNSLATTSPNGQVEGLCYAFGTTDMQRDVWFTWTPSLTGTGLVRTCGGFVDTKIAAYAGAGCPANGTALACNDDFCGFQSSIGFPVTAGNTYTLQIGVFPGATGGADSFEAIVVNPPANDDCSTPTAIAGQGIFAFDNTVATTGAQGQAEGLCYAFGSTTVDSDLWYSWTADDTGLALVTTCGLTGVDTKISAYPGTGCPASGTSIACNDDACGFQSTIGFDVTNGTTYTLQLGTFPGAAGGSGSMDIQIVQPPDCYTYDFGSSENSVGLTAGGDMIVLNAFTAGGGADVITEISATYGTPLFPGNYTPGPIVLAIWDDPTNDFDPTDAVLLYTQNGNASPASTDTDVFQQFVIPNVAVSGVFFIGVMFDNHVSGQYPASLDQSFPGGNRSWVAGSTTGNGDLANLTNNDVFPQTIDSAGLPGRWMVRAVGPNCNFGQGVGTGYCAGDGSGTACPCGNTGTAGRGCANSTASGGGLLTATGSPSVGAGNLTLVGEGLQPSQPGLYFQGDNVVNGGNGIVFGDGLRCAGGNVIRLQIRVSDANGESATTVNIAALTGVSAGDTKRYQLWYRNPNFPTGSPCGTGFNLTNGLQVLWTP